MTKDEERDEREERGKKCWGYNVLASSFSSWPSQVQCQIYTHNQSLLKDNDVNEIKERKDEREAMI